MGGKDKIRVPSADGWNEIEFAFANSADEMSTELCAKGQFWERDQNSEIDSKELVDDFEVNFMQAILLKGQLALFRDSLESWFREPKEIDLELSSSSYPRVSVFIGELDEFICSESKPVFVLNYQDSRVETKVKFVVDQSCLNLVLQDLKKCLK